MSRRSRRVQRYHEPPGGALELVIGAGGRCHHPPPEVGRRGPCPDPVGCFSAFDSDEHREAVYWQQRDALVVDRSERGPWAGTRAWAFWLYEAHGLCAHRPACRLTTDRHHDVAQARWLAYHEALTVAERRRILGDGLGVEGALRDRGEAMAAAVREGIAAREAKTAWA